MDNLLIYLLEANVLLALLMLVYFAMRNRLSFRQRRLSLLAIPFFAFLIVIWRIYGVSEVNTVYTLPVYELNALEVPPITEWQQRGLTFWPAFDRIYLIGFTIALVILLIKIVRITSKLMRAKSEKRNGLHIVLLENENCFSFFNYVQLNPSLSPDQQALVLEHEQIHIAQKHTYDKLFMATAQSINWFNPLFVLLKKELMNVHEYEVDQLMYQRHETNYMEFLLAYSLRTNSTPYLLTNQFYTKNGLIKRLHFMKKQPKNNWALALAIPLLAGSFALVSWNISASEKQPTRNVIFAFDQVIEDEAEKMPEFKGGQDALVKYLMDNLAYPESAKNAKIEGTVYISFLVENTGKVTNCNVKRSVNTDLDNEALRVVTAMPDWIPGEKDGKKVNVEMVLPVAFKL